MERPARHPDRDSRDLCREATASGRGLLPEHGRGRVVDAGPSPITTRAPSIAMGMERSTSAPHPAHDGGVGWALREPRASKVSTDAGATWSSLTSGLAWPFVWPIATAPVAGQPGERVRRLAGQWLSIEPRSRAEVRWPSRKRRRNAGAAGHGLPAPIRRAGTSRSSFSLATADRRRSRSSTSPGGAWCGAKWAAWDPWITLIPLPAFRAGAGCLRDPTRPGRPHRERLRSGRAVRRVCRRTYTLTIPRQFRARATAAARLPPRPRVQTGCGRR
jgi:hypothetical protein